MKAITLIAFPLAIFIVISLIFNNALAWQTTYGSDLTQDTTFLIISSDSPILLLLTGKVDVLWSQLLEPSVNWGFITILADFIGGVVLTILGLGITVSLSAEAATIGAGGTFGIGDQGAKLAQTVGIGMIVWAIVAGTLGSWVLYFDAIATGVGTVIFLLFQFVFTIGLVWQTQTQF